MNRPIGGTGSSRPSPRNGEENISMYFDFGHPPQDGQTTFQAMQSSSSQDGHEPTPRGGGIRVSLACIPVSSFMGIIWIDH